MALNPRDQRRWDSLQDSGQAHIDRIIAGRGTQEDLSAISRLLSEQHELAGQLFEQGVDDAVQTANQVVADLERKRIESGKRALTDRAQARLFNRAFQDVMSQAIDDILGRVHDEFEAQDAAIRNRVESALERIRAHPTPRAVEGARSPADRLLGTPSQTVLDEAPQPASERSLMDRVLERQAETDRQRTEVMQFIRDTASSIRDRVGSLYERFSRSNDEDREERAATVWMRKLKLLLSPLQRSWSAAKRGASKAADFLDMISKPLLMAVMNPQLVRTITDEVSKLLNFGTISKFVDDTWDETKKMGTDSLDWIIDKVKSWIGLGPDKKKKAETKVDAVATAAKASQTVTTLPKEISAADAQKALPTQQSGLTQAQQRLASAQARYKASPTSANKKAVDEAQMSVNYWQSRVTMYGARAASAKTAGSDIDQARTLVSAAAQAAPADSSISSEVTTAPAQTSIASPSVALGQSSAAVPATATQVVGDLPRFTPGKSFDSPLQKKSGDEAAEAKAKAAIAQIGLGSFGFDSPDPSLNILNLGMVS